MPDHLQAFFAKATPKAASDLEAALLRLPADKRDWSSTPEARTALDMVAECALLNGTTADLLQTRVFPANYDMAAFMSAKAELRQDWNALKSLLQASVAKVVAATRAVPDDALETEIALPWGPMTLAQIIAYPYWNMAYHEGQINYIASTLGG